ncbi:hypothetical protein ACXR0O_23635 [Verrucomicrobiota bacterium sgz303538]
MAVILSMNYTKKLGLPQYSSHSCSLSVQVEVSDLSQLADESSRLYELLQSSVDAEIQKVGFMPDVAYGIGNSNGMGSANGAQASNGNGSHTQNRHVSPANGTNCRERWNCTEGQKGLILRVVNENGLEKTDVEALARERFGVGVKECNKMQASELIEELLEKTGRKPAGTNGRSRWRSQPSRA